MEEEKWCDDGGCITDAKYEYNEKKYCEEHLVEKMVEDGLIQAVPKSLVFFDGEDFLGDDEDYEEVVENILNHFAEVKPIK